MTVQAVCLADCRGQLAAPLARGVALALRGPGHLSTLFEALLCASLQHAHCLSRAFRVYTNARARLLAVIGGGVPHALLVGLALCRPGVAVLAAAEALVGRAVPVASCFVVFALVLSHNLRALLATFLIDGIPDAMLVGVAPTLVLVFDFTLLLACVPRAVPPTE